MRVGFVLVVLGFLWALACTSTDITDEECIKAGGVCFTDLELDMGCSTPLTNVSCYKGYTCCTNAYAANLVNNMIVDAATGAPDRVGDTGVDATDAPLDTGAKDAATDVHTATDATMTDAKKD